MIFLLTQRHKGTEFFDRINRIYRIHFLNTEYTKYTEQNHLQCIRCIPWFIIYPSDGEQECVDMLIELYVLNTIVFLPSFISRLAFPFDLHISSNSAQSLLIFGNNLFKTTSTMAHGRTRPCTPSNYINIERNAGVFARAPLKICVLQL